MDEFLSLCDKAWYYRSIVSWECAFVATGGIDAVIWVDSKYYDNAPFALLVTEAWGTVTTLDGWVFSQQDTSMIASNGQFHNQLIDIFAEKWKKAKHW